MLACVLAIIALVGAKCSSSRSDADDPDLRKIESEARAALLAYVSNPDTVEIRNQTGRCGQFRHRDFYGRESDYRRFISSNDNDVMVEAEYHDQAFEHLWTRFCLGQN